MSRKKQKTFTSPREIIETYFPDYSRQKVEVVADGYRSCRPDLVGKLAERFAASLRRKTNRQD